ncbi:MAG: VanZ family protein [Chitinophagaceae bacterium]
MPPRIIQSRWTAIGWTMIIFLLMIMPASNIPSQGLFRIPHLDKLVHFFLFGGFVWLWYFSLKKNAKKHPPQVILKNIFLISAFYGISMEFIQYFFTARSFDIWDIVADILGGSIAWGILSIREKK